MVPDHTVNSLCHCDKQCSFFPWEPSTLNIISGINSNHCLLVKISYELPQRRCYGRYEITGMLLVFHGFHILAVIDLSTRKTTERQNTLASISPVSLVPMEGGIL